MRCPCTTRRAASVRSKRVALQSRKHGPLTCTLRTSTTRHSQSGCCHKIQVFANHRGSASGRYLQTSQRESLPPLSQLRLLSMVSHPSHSTSIHPVIHSQSVVATKTILCHVHELTTLVTRLFSNVSPSTQITPRRSPRGLYTHPSAQGRNPRRATTSASEPGRRRRCCPE